MAAYSVSAPNGVTYDIEGPEGASQQDIVNAVSAQYPEALIPKKPEQGLLSRAASEGESLLTQAGTGIKSLFGDSTEAAKAGLASQQAQQAALAQKYAEDPGYFGSIEQAYQSKPGLAGLYAAGKEAAYGIPKALAEASPMMAEAAALSRAGAAAGTMIEPGLGTVIGGIAAPIVGLGVNALGSFQQEKAARQQAAGQPIDVPVHASDIGLALGSGALMEAQSLLPLGASFLSKITNVPANAILKAGGTPALEKLANESLLSTIGKGTVTGLAEQVPIMVTNEMLNRAEMGDSLTSQEALTAYAKAAESAVPFAPMGILGRMGKKAEAGAALAEDQYQKQQTAAQAAADAKAIQDQAAADAAAKQAEYQKTQPYLDEITQQYQAVEQQKLDLLNQKRTVESESLTETADRLHNKDIDAQVKALQPTIEDLAQKYNEAKKNVPQEPLKALTYNPTPEEEPKIDVAPIVTNTPETKPEPPDLFNTTFAEPKPQPEKELNPVPESEAGLNFQIPSWKGLDTNSEYVEQLTKDLQLTKEAQEKITGVNLLGLVGRLKLNNEDWTDIGGLPYFARGKDGIGTPISTRVEDGEFDPWLPYGLRSNVIKSDPDKALDAEEFIKEALRNHGAKTPFYPTEVRDELRNQDEKAYHLSQELFKEGEPDAINRAIQDVATEIAAEDLGNRPAEDFGAEPTGETSNTVAGQAENAREPYIEPEPLTTQVTEAPVAPTVTPKTKAPPKEKPVAEKRVFADQDVNISPAEIAGAQKFLDGVDSGVVKLTPGKLNTFARNFGLDVKPNDDPAQTMERFRAVVAKKSGATETPVSAATKEFLTTKIPKQPTERQQRIEFGKKIGATQSYPGSLSDRTNLAAQKAAKAGNFQGVLDALEKSKNPLVAEVARLARTLKTKIEIDDTASETYEGKSRFTNQMSIDGAKMHLAALQKLREMKPIVDSLPGNDLPFAARRMQIETFQDGKPYGKMALEDIAHNNHSMFSPLGLEDTSLRTKQDFNNLLNAFERITAEHGENNLRLTSTASAIRQGVAGVYDEATDTIKVPEYYAKSEGVLAHEIVHAQAVQIVANPTAEQRPAVERLNKLYEHVKNVADSEEAKDPSLYRRPYGVASIQEFLAEGLSNPDFQYQLSRIKYENTSVWGKFVETIGKMVGLKNDNALTELLSIYKNIVQEPEAKLSGRTIKTGVGMKAQSDPAKIENLKKLLTPFFAKFNLQGVGLKILDQGGDREGSYEKGIIGIALDANTPIRVMRHETIHAMRELGFFTPGQFKLLENEANRVWIDKYLKQRDINGLPLRDGVESRYDAYMRLYNGDVNAVREEAIADAFAHFDIDGAPKGIFANLLEKMRQFFTAVKNAFNGAGFETAQDVFKQIDAGELGIGRGSSGELARASLRTAPDTPEFKQWFDGSKAVDANGQPKVWYHGTAKDTASFGRKTARGAPVFLTDNPAFAEKFSKDSFAFMAAHADQMLTPAQIAEGKTKAIVAIREDYRRDPALAKEMMDSIKNGDYRNATAEAQEYLRYAYKEMMPSGPHIMPVYVAAKNPFDYQNPEHVDALIAQLNKNFDSYGRPYGTKERGYIERGYWETIEQPYVQRALKELGHDSFYVQEDGNKNLAVYEPEQIKSATGNTGAYGARPVTEAEAKPLGMTAEEANKAQAAGDVRFSVRKVEEDIRGMANGEDILNAIDGRTTQREELGYPERVLGSLGPQPFSYLRQKLMHRYNQLGVYGRKIAKEMGGIERLADIGAEQAALDSDRVAGVVASAMGVGNRTGGVPVYAKGYTTISNLNGSVKGVVDTFAPLAKYGDPKIYQAYQFWAMAKRGERLTAEGRETFTQRELDYAKSLGEKYPEFEQVQKDWIKYNDGLVKYMIDTGVITKEAGQEWTKYSDYVPFYRQLDGEQTMGPRIFQNITGVKPPRQLKGSEAPAADFLETIVRNTQAAIQSGMKNVAGQRAIDEADFLGMVKKLDHPMNSPNVVSILRNGKAEHYLSADALWIDAVKSLNLPEMPFLSILSKPSDVLRSMVTKDPAFIVANMMKHALYTYATSGADINPVTDTIKNFTNVLANRSPEYQKLLDAGVIGGYEFSRNAESSAAALSKDLMQKAGTEGAFKTAMKPIRGVWQYLEHATEAHDAAVRIAVYKDVMAKTGNEAEALHRAMEVLNFNRKGNSALIRIITAAIPFLNAKYQGLDLMYRAGVRPIFDKDATEAEKAIQKKFLIRAATMTALSTMYAASVMGDPDYEKQQQEVRDNNWIIPGLGVRIPTPFEFGLLFKAIPEHIYRYSFDKEGAQDLQKIAKKGLSDLFFTPIAQSAMPALEAETNYSFFTGRPIVGAHLQGLAPERQIEPGTSSTAIELGKMTGMSPVLIDHIYQGYTGTIGMYLSDAIDAVVNQGSGIQNPTMRLEQTPVIKRFLLDNEATGQVSEFYDLKTSVEQVVKTVADMKKTNAPELAEYETKNSKLLSAKAAVESVAKKLQDLKQQAIQIRGSNLGGDEKRDLLLQNVKAQNLAVTGIREARLQLMD